MIVRGAPAFNENNWWIFKIGDATFEGINKCSRCIFTTLNYDTLEYDPNNEPITTLKKLNFDPPLSQFGLYAKKRSAGTVRVGDRLTVISRKKLAPNYD